MKEDDLISREAAISLANDLIIEDDAHHDYNQAINNYAAELIGLPSAQPEIIRCKDCRYYKTYQYVNGIRQFLPKCGFNDIYVAEEDFCSQAERRQDDR